MKTYYLKKTFGYEKFVAIGKTHSLTLLKSSIEKSDHNDIDWLLGYYKSNEKLVECTKAEFDAFHIEVSTFINQPLEEIEESTPDDSLIDREKETLNNLFKDFGEIYNGKPWWV